MANYSKIILLPILIDNTYFIARKHTCNWLGPQVLTTLVTNLLFLSAALTVCFPLILTNEQVLIEKQKIDGLMDDLQF